MARESETRLLGDSGLICAAPRPGDAARELRGPRPEVIWQAKAMIEQQFHERGVAAAVRPHPGSFA